MSEQERARRDIDGTEVIVVQGDITQLKVEAIVNAANRQLQHGGGVAAAIASAGGAVIQEESNAWIEEHGGLDPGTAAVTGAGDMPCSLVIHVAGPVYDPDSHENEDLLRAAVTAALDTADRHDVSSVAFPAISAGVYGYPQPDATRIIASQVATWIRELPGHVFRVYLVGFDEQGATDFAEGLRRA